MRIERCCWLGSSAATVLLFLLVVGDSSGLTVMSVDFGAEFMKVAVVAPGVPMEIALNKESKRKTPVAIAFRDGERTFGDDAITAGMRSPQTVFTNLVHLLGKSTSHPIVQAYQQAHPQHTIIPHPSRGTVVFNITESQQSSVEELVAQVLQHARDQASAYTAQPVKDLVITVPAFFNQAERRALMEAAEMAQLKVLSLISSNAAVALNYGMFRRKEVNGTAQLLIFYDMGASQTTASVVSFQTVKTKERGYSETNPQLTVLGVGFDRTLGGYEMQLRLRNFLAHKFNDLKKASSDVFLNQRALSKINKEAARLKHVLSANNEHVSQIENVMEDVDLRVMVRRSDLEELIAPLVARAWNPVNDALVAAGVDISEISQLVLVGGATRVPAVQDKLQREWGRELSRNINADEAAALGAVYRAADMGQGFKVKTFHVREANLYPIEVEFDRAVEHEDGRVVDRVVKRSLFAVGNTFPQKKVMTFNKHTNDFDFRINYGDMSEHRPAAQIREQFGSVSFNITHASVTGVADAYAKHVTETGAEFKGIKAHFSLDVSGILRLGDVELVVERNVTMDIPPPVESKDEESTMSKIGSTLSKLFGGDESDNSTAAAGEAANTTTEAGAGANKTKTDTKGGAAADKQQQQLITDKIALNCSQQHLDLPLLSEQDAQDALQKLVNISAAETERELRAAGRNSLETLLLDIRDKLGQEEYEVASELSVRDTLLEQCSLLEDWLYDDGFDAEATTYKEKIAGLENVFGPIAQRVEEHRQRPHAIQALNNMLNRSSDFLQRAQAAPEAETWFTTVELQNLDDLIVDTQRWLEKEEDAQVLLTPAQDPVLTLDSIAEKIHDLDREMKYLFNKAKLAKAKADREAAEAKAKADREIKEAERKKKKQLKEAADEQKEEEINGEERDDGDASRAEPPLPEEPELEDTSTEDVTPDPDLDDKPHAEL